MENEENEALVRHFYKELDAGNLDAVDEAFDAACVMHYPGNVTLHSPEGYKSNMDPFLTGLPDFEHVVDDIFSVGDKVVVRFTITATHTGEFAGLTPTGKKISFTVMAVFRIDEDKIAEMWVEYDALSLMQQLGATLS